VCADAVLPIDPESTESIAAAIDRMATDAELRASLAAAGPSRARRFSWEATARQHTAIYARVAATSASAERST
jgi:glycosyltransferase involved in cell wall biosynthesis